MAEFPDTLIEQATTAVRPYLAYFDDGFPEEAARAVLEAVAPAIRAQALHDAADEMSRRLDTFPQNGRHTRARWAEWFIRERADQINPKEAT